jgi:uridylate kinase
MSGESISGSNENFFDFDMARRICADIKRLLERGIKASIVIGGGNIIRGRSLGNNIRREAADSVGMCATAINGMLLSEIFSELSVSNIILSPINMPFGIENSNIRTIEANKDRLIIFVGGTGFPHFSTDTAAVINAVIIGADILLKATKTNGIYDVDPHKYSNAKFIPNINYESAIKNNIEVMDRTAFVLAMENNLKIMVFSMNEDDCFCKAIDGDISRSIVS